MSAAATPKTAIDLKNELLTQVTDIVKGISPDIASDVKAQIEDGLKRMFDSGFEKEKKVGDKAVSDIIAAQTDALTKLKKELKEAEDQIASKEKTAITAFSDAMSDWSTAMKLDPKITTALKMIPDIAGQFQAVIDAAKKIKENKHDITLNVFTFVGSLLGLAITVMTLVVLVMQVFGR